jgi:Manganese containing catalase
MCRSGFSRDVAAQVAPILLRVGIPDRHSDRAEQDVTILVRPRASIPPPGTGRCFLNPVTGVAICSCARIGFSITPGPSGPIQSTPSSCKRSWAASGARSFPQELELREVSYQFLNFSEGEESRQGRWAEGPSVDGKGQIEYLARPPAMGGVPELGPVDPRLQGTPKKPHKAVA